VAVWWCSSSVLACERRGGGPEWWLCAEAAASGSMAGSSLMGCGGFLAWLGWQFCVACAARLSARSTRLSGGGWTLSRGGGSGCWCGGRGLRAVLSGSLGCGRPGRAASQLDRERWYVGMAVPEGGVGGLRWAWRSGWMSGRRPRKFGSVVGIDLVSCGRQGRFGAVLLEVWLLHLPGASFACSSHSSHGVFSPARVGG
jgi:hypothetical protein